MSAATDPAGDPFEALGDPHRRAIIELLGGGERSVQQIADQLPISRPAVSRHLRVLKGAGLVVDRPQGSRRLYDLDAAGVRSIREYLERVWGNATVTARGAGVLTAYSAAGAMVEEVSR